MSYHFHFFQVVLKSYKVFQKHWLNDYLAKELLKKSSKVAVCADEVTEKMITEIKLAQELGLPIVSHTGGCEEARSIRLYNAAKAHPEIDFVMVHLDLGTDNREAIDLLGKLPNLYGDTTWVPIKSALEVIRRYGGKKLLFGTDNPIDGEDTLLCNMFGERSLYQQYFNELREMLTADEYDDLMYRNAQRVFGIHINE